MTKISIGLLSGILVTIIMLASGTTYYLEKTGDYKTCNVGGWVLSEDTGQYVCKDRGLTEWCAELSEPSKEGISTRCYIGRVILTEPDYGDFAEKIEGDELIRHTDTYDYEVWELQEKFNTIDVQEGIDYNAIELSALEVEYKACEDLKDEKYITLCEYDVLRKIDFILGESASYDIKLEKVK